MSICAVLVVRLGSSRLPGKAMLPILGKPMIGLMAERIRKASMIDKVVIATSDFLSDDPLQELSLKHGIGCHRGSLENVTERILGAANEYDCETIVELLGDNPLVHANLVDEVVRFYREGGYDYAATVTKEYPTSEHEKRLFSIGVRVQVYSRAAAEDYVTYPEYMNNENKHPCAYLFENPKRYKIGYFEAKEKWAFMNRPELSFAVNYRKNFEMIRSIFEKNYPNDNNFSLEKVFRQLDQDKYLYLLMGN